MNVNDVITLDNDANYLILDEFEYENKNYLFTIGLYDDGNLDYEDCIFLEKIEENNEIYVEKIADNKLIEKLLLIAIASLDESDELVTTLEQELKHLNKEEGSN